MRAGAIAAVLAAVTAVVMLAALRADELAVAGTRITVVDTAAVGALAAVLLALARGKADVSSLQQGGTGVLLLLLPALVLFVLAVVVARLLGPLLRLLERGARSAPAAVRVALLSLARAPGEVALAVVFFVLSVGIAVFAFAYRATLVQGEHDQATYAVPAPYVLQEDLTKLVPVLDAAPPRLNGFDVLRDDGEVTGAGDFTLLALPAGALTRIDGWRTDFSSRSPKQLASLLAPAHVPQLAGFRAPRTIRFTIDGDRIGLTVVVQNRRGDFTQVDLGEHGRGTFARALPSLRGRVVALRLAFPTVAAFVADHKDAETGQAVADASTGTIRLGAAFRRWLGTGGVTLEAPGVYHYVVNRAADSIIRPEEPGEGDLVPVVASPAIARAADSNGIVNLHVEDSVISAKVVAVARYFPTVDGEFVVADLPTWLVAANTAEPGIAVPDEIWSQEKPPPLPVQVTSQRTEERQLRGDAISRGSIALLLVVAVLGLVLAVAGLVLTVLGDRRDERSSLTDLSVQGVTPRGLRRHLLLRAGVLGTLGIAGGLGAGLLVGTLVVAVVTVTAGAQSALPPLALVFDWPLVAAALGIVAAACAVGAWGATRR
jgi:hypothetical protein